MRCITKVRNKQSLHSWNRLRLRLNEPLEPPQSDEVGLSSVCSHYLISIHLLIQTEPFS